MGAFFIPQRGIFFSVHGKAVFKPVERRLPSGGIRIPDGLKKPATGFLGPSGGLHAFFAPSELASARVRKGLPGLFSLFRILYADDAGAHTRSNGVVVWDVHN